MHAPTSMQPKASSTQDQNHYENNPMGTLIQSGFNVSCEYQTKSIGEELVPNVLDHQGNPTTKHIYTVITKMSVNGPGVNLQYTVEGDSKISTRRAGATRAINFLMSLSPPPVRLANIVSGKELVVDTSMLISQAQTLENNTTTSEGPSSNQSHKRDAKRNFIKSFLQLGFFPLTRVIRSADPINGIQASAKLTLSETDTIFYGSGPSATVAKNECLVKAFEYIKTHNLRPGVHESGHKVDSKLSFPIYPKPQNATLIPQQKSLSAKRRIAPTSTPEGSRNQPSLRGSRNQPPLLGSRNQPPLLGSRNQPLLLGSRNQPPLLGSRNQQPLLGSRNQPRLRGSRNQPPLLGSRNQPPLRGSRNQPPLRGSRNQPSLKERSKFLRPPPRSLPSSDEFYDNIPASASQYLPPQSRPLQGQIRLSNPRPLIQNYGPEDLYRNEWNQDRPPPRPLFNTSPSSRARGRGRGTSWAPFSDSYTYDDYYQDSFHFPSEQYDQQSQEYGLDLSFDRKNPEYGPDYSFDLQNPKYGPDLPFERQQHYAPYDYEYDQDSQNTFFDQPPLDCYDNQYQPNYNDRPPRYDQGPEGPIYRQNFSRRGLPPNLPSPSSSYTSTRGRGGFIGNRRARAARGGHRGR